MKKLSKLHIGLIIVIILALAGSVYFLFGYREVEAKQPDIQDEINIAIQRLAIAREEDNLDDLKLQLTELQAEINTVSAGEPLFPEEPPSVEIGDLIVDSVHKLQLELLKLKADPDAGTETIKSDEDSEGNKYSKAEYEVKVKGHVGRINSLIGDIEGAEFATLLIEDLEISFEEKEEEGVIIAEWWEAEFTIVTLYQYKEEK